MKQFHNRRNNTAEKNYAIEKKYIFHYTGNPNKLIIMLDRSSEPFSPKIKWVKIGYAAVSTIVKIDQELKNKLENRIKEFSKTQLISAI